MALYLRHPRAEKRHPEVVALSALLRGAALARSTPISANYRNPAGIAMKLRNFAKSDPSPISVQGKGLRGGGKVDRIVWGEFGSDAAALAHEVTRIRKDFALGKPTALAPSRGPPPEFGAQMPVRDDAGSLVYLLLVYGPIDLLAPGRTGASDDHMIMKVGRTVDLERRIADFRSGLPPRSSIAYVPLSVRKFSQGREAHVYEQAVLTSCQGEGLSLGGEFVLAQPDKVLSLMDRIADGSA